MVLTCVSVVRNENDASSSWVHSDCSSTRRLAFHLNTLTLILSFSVARAQLGTQYVDPDNGITFFGLTDPGARCDVRVRLPPTRVGRDRVHRGDRRADCYGVVWREPGGRDDHELAAGRLGGRG